MSNGCGCKIDRPTNQRWTFLFRSLFMRNFYEFERLNARTSSFLPRLEEIQAHPAQAEVKVGFFASVALAPTRLSTFTLRHTHATLRKQTVPNS
jgi:hypothetical protein